MYTYTTPTIHCTIEGVSWSGADLVRLAIKGRKSLLKEIPIGDVDTATGEISVPLTQEETAMIGAGLVWIQARIRYTNGKVMATNKVSKRAEEVIDKVVI